MAMTPPLSLSTGTRGAYQWLTTTEHDLDSFLTLCPAAVLGKYLAVTSFDSGFLSLNDVEKAAGWESRGNIAYSPRIQSFETLPARGGYDEWYLFGAPVDLGQVGRGNVFEAPLLPGQVEVFVNFGVGFGLHRPEEQSLATLFWRQLEWIRPESYIADGDHFLTFVSCSASLFTAVRHALSERVP